MEYGYWLPPNLSANGAEIDFAINIIHVMMLVLFVGWSAFIAYCLVKFRAREGHKATYEPIEAKFTTWLEVGVSIAEVVLLIGLSMPVWADIKEKFPKAQDNPVEIRVVAQQYEWVFHYPGKDGVFGRTLPELMDEENAVGLDYDNDDAALDDFTSASLHVPVNRPVICRLTSKDVIHGFNLNVLRVKQDVIPGMEIAVWFEATAESNKLGKDGKKRTAWLEYTGRAPSWRAAQVGCAQLCGRGHNGMQADLFIESSEDFQSWLDAEHKKLGLEDGG